MRVGLSSYGDIPTGLGQLAARFWRRRGRLGLTGRFVVRHGKLGVGKALPGVHAGGLPADWLAGVDAVLFLERPMPDGLAAAAKVAGKRTVLVVMPEWLPPAAPWLGHVDCFIVFTRQGEEHCRKLGLGPRTARVACPLDLEELPFRGRTRVESVVYLDGWGGVHERKGWPEVRELLKLSPGLVRVKSQRGLPGAEPAADSPAALYADADAVLVPGRFDGLGLTVLEALASGCVVLATDAEPYREFVGAAYGCLLDDRTPWRRMVQADPAKARTVPVWGNPWPSRPASVAGIHAAVTAARLMPSDEVAELSRAGRDYAECVHGGAAWAALGDAIRGGGDG